MGICSLQIFLLIQITSTVQIKHCYRQNIKRYSQDLLQAAFGIELRYGTVRKNNFFHNYGSVSDPDWIQIQLGLWIQILIENPDPDPGRHKWATKNKNKGTKFMLWRAGCSLAWKSFMETKNKYILILQFLFKIFDWKIFLFLVSKVQDLIRIRIQQQAQIRIHGYGNA